MSDTYLEVFGRRLVGWRATAVLFFLAFCAPFIVGAAAGAVLMHAFQ